MYDTEQLQKQAQDQARQNLASAAVQAQCATIGGLNNAKNYARPSLTERLRKSLEHAQQEQSTNEKRHELLYLLDKNPEVARILELFDEVGGR